MKITDGQVEIDYEACFGCSICQLHCPAQCLKLKKALFDDLLGQGAAAVIDNLPKNTFYVSFIKNVTRLCDCGKHPGEIISPDIGVLFSSNPVAIDKASVDLINKVNGRDVFKEANHKDPLSHVKFCREYISRTWDYEMTEI